jgi:hypothetical protein
MNYEKKILKKMIDDIPKEQKTIFNITYFQLLKKFSPENVKEMVDNCLEDYNNKPAKNKKYFSVYDEIALDIKRELDVYKIPYSTTKMKEAITSVPISLRRDKFEGHTIKEDLGILNKKLFTVGFTKDEINTFLKKQKKVLEEIVNTKESLEDIYYYIEENYSSTYSLLCKELGVSSKEVATKYLETIFDVPKMTEIINEVRKISSKSLQTFLRKENINIKFLAELYKKSIRAYLPEANEANIYEMYYLTSICAKIPEISRIKTIKKLFEDVTKKYVELSSDNSKWKGIEFAIDYLNIDPCKNSWIREEMKTYINNHILSTCPDKLKEIYNLGRKYSLISKEDEKEIKTKFAIATEIELEYLKITYGTYDYNYKDLLKLKIKKN